MLVLDIAYLCTKFDNCSLSHSRDMAGANQNLNGSHDLTTPLSGMIYHPWASTCYDQHTYQVWLGLVRSDSRSLKIAPFDRVHTTYSNIP